MALSTDVAEALTALERHRGPLTAWQQGQVRAWQLRGDPSPVEHDRLVGLLGRPAEPEQRSKGKAAAKPPTRCPHCGRRQDQPGVLG